MLDGFGYQSDSANQSPQVVYGIVLLFTLFPAVGHLALIAIAQFYRLDDERCMAIRDELAERTVPSSSS